MCPLNPSLSALFFSFDVMLRIALPNKGRLSQEARELFTDAGLEIRAAGPRALTASLGGEFQALFVRAQDIPEFVADGAADAGVTGFDLIRESGRTLDELADLEFGRCRLAVAAKEDSGVSSLADITGGMRVATVFPRIAKAFFDERQLAVEVVPVSGAAEIAPHIGIADVIVDLVSTGSTLRVNGLHEIATVLESSSRLISTPSVRADAARSRALDEAGRCAEQRPRGSWKAVTSWRTSRANDSRTSSALSLASTVPP